MSVSNVVPTDARTRRLLEAPVVPTLLGMAVPALAVVLTQNSLGIAEVHFIGRLGVDALAGISLVLPICLSRS